MLPKEAIIALLVILPAFGACGIYLAMAGRQRSTRWASLAALLIAAGAAVALAVPLIAAGTSRFWFIALSLIGLVGAVRMITHKQPVYSAVYFILVILAVTGLLVLMQAKFLAAALLIIYAGAILVTYVFVIMLAQQSGPAAYDSQAREPLLGCVVGFALLLVIVGRMFAQNETGVAATPIDVAETGTALNLGARLLTNYVVALQAAGVLLLAALVGAIAIARRKAGEDTLEEAD